MLTLRNISAASLFIHARTAVRTSHLNKCVRIWHFAHLGGIQNLHFADKSVS